jgi:hypothetical protein
MDDVLSGPFPRLRDSGSSVAILGSRGQATVPDGLTGAVAG